MVKIDPITRQRFTHARHCGDIIIDANPPTGDEALTNESVPIIGEWSDYTGSGGPNTRTLMMFGASENSLFGTTPHIEGDQAVRQLNNVGEPQNIIRRRLKKIYHKLD